MIQVKLLDKTTLAKEIKKLIPGCILASSNDILKNDVVIITQGTSRGGFAHIFKKSLTDVIERILEISSKSNRIIVVGSLGGEFTSWPGIQQDRMMYNIAKHCLSRFVQDWNQAGNECRIQICEPASFKTPMSGNTGMEITKVVDAINFLIRNPEITKIQLRKNQ